MKSSLCDLQKRELTFRRRTPSCLWALILGVGFIFAPESPRWLFGRGRPEAAEKSLARIRGVKVEDNDYSVRTAYHEMEEAVQRAKGMKDFSWLDCFKPENKLLCTFLSNLNLLALER